VNCCGSDTSSWSKLDLHLLEFWLSLCICSDRGDSRLDMIQELLHVHNQKMNQANTISPQDSTGVEKLNIISIWRRKTTSILNTIRRYTDLLPDKALAAVANKWKKSSRLQTSSNAKLHINQ
ncbi:hypothetical protein GIB67_001614, partial [Kingdonia uniflora]